MNKVIIVNKFGPFSNAITGRNAKEMADFLCFNTIAVTFICLNSEYKVAAIKNNQQELPYDIIELRQYYKGTTSYLRFLFGFLDGFRLWLTSLKYKADAIIVMTDPPLLIFWFQLFRKFSKRKLFYWTMDIYPEAFVAGKYIDVSNVFYKFFHVIIYRKIPDLIIALGSKQLEYLEEKFHRSVFHVILPCGIIERNGMPEENPAHPDKISFCYGGNIGEAHDADFLISLIKQLDPKKHEIILSLYGSKAEYVKRIIKNTKVVHFRDFLNPSDIAAIDVNVATLLPEWNHICVPSKAVTSICCGSPLLLNSTKEADAWHMFKEAVWLIEAGKNYEVAIQKSIEAITKQEIFAKKAKAKELAKDIISSKNKALEDIVTAIRN